MDLATGEANTPGADHRVEPFGHHVDVSGHGGYVEGLIDHFLRDVVSQHEVVMQGHREQTRDLWGVCNSRWHHLRRRIHDCFTIPLDGTIGCGQESEDGSEQCCLAGSDATSHHHELARSHGEVDV